MIEAPWRRQWRDYIIAIIAGNLAYFFLLEPWLPEALHHRPFHLDVGLALDFVVCVASYFIWLRVSRGRGSG